MDNGNLILDNVNKQEDLFKSVEKQDLKTEQKDMDAFKSQNIQISTEQNETGVFEQTDVVMPQVISGEQAELLAQNEQTVIERTETERSMPQTHVAIAEARARIDRYNRGKDSEEMRAVKEKSDELNKFVKYNAITPCSDEEFSSNLSEVKAGYDELIATCKIYIKKSGSPITKKGKRRLGVVKDILLQAITERKMIEDSANALRAKVKNDEKAILMFEDLIPAIAVPPENLIVGEKQEVSEESVKSVMVSRLAAKLGASDMVPEADIKTYRTAEGLKDFVVSSGAPNEIKSDKKSNTAKIISSLTGNLTRQQMADMLSEIKSSEEKADRDVLNNLLTTSAEDLLLSLGSLYDPKTAKAFIANISLFKNELVKSGLDKELDLYVMNTETDISVSLFTEEEKKLSLEEKEIAENEKDGLLKEGTEENTIEYSTEEPFISADIKGFHEVAWEDKTNEPLFAHEPSLNDVKQGDLGDCYFLSVIGNLALTSPNIIKDMMRDNKDGTVTVRFFDFDRKREQQLSPVYVRVKKTVPKKVKDNKDIYARDCLWVQLIEKAFVCSGLAISMQEVYDKIYEKNEKSTSFDLRDFNVSVVAGELKATGNTIKDIKEGKHIDHKMKYEDLESGFAQIVPPLITGKYMKDMGVEKDNLYWNDSGFAKESYDDKDKKIDLKGVAKFKNFLINNDKASMDYVAEMMERHDEQREKDIEKENEKIKEYNLSVEEKKKQFSAEQLKKMNRTELKKNGIIKRKPIIFRRRDKIAGNISKDEAALSRYYMLTGKKIPADKEKDPATKEKIEVTNGFVSEFLNYLDSKEDLSQIDVSAGKLYLKHLKDFVRGFVRGVTDNAKKALREAFLKSEDYVKVCEWMKNRFKNPADNMVARYSPHSGKYFGKALEAFDNIGKALKEKKEITTDFGKRLERIATDQNSKVRGKKGELSVGGLYGGHSYSVAGVTERKFGGKTYKFVSLRNPWGDGGTEYFYNPKTKKLDRRTVKDKNSTNGYTLVELSDYMMFSEDVYVKDTVGVKGEAQ